MLYFCNFKPPLKLNSIVIELRRIHLMNLPVASEVSAFSNRPNIYSPNLSHMLSILQLIHIGSHWQCTVNDIVKCMQNIIFVSLNCLRLMRSYIVNIHSLQLSDFEEVASLKTASPAERRVQILLPL